MNVTLLVPLFQLIVKLSKELFEQLCIEVLVVIMVVRCDDGDLDTPGEARPLVCCIFVPERPPVDGGD